MPSLPKRRRVKRATIVAKKSQLAKNDRFKKRSYQSLYENMKASNNALAKALAKEKQEYRHMITKNISLTSEVHDLKVACNQRDDLISGVLKNAKDTLQHLVTMTGNVTNIIVACQQFPTTMRDTSRRLSTNDRRESSTRRLSGKSPARGVVQPMVSGHTITKPTINLSRLNIPRQYNRVQTPPNLSNIEEGSTPEASPVAPARTSTVRSPITRPLNDSATRINRLSERRQNSMRVSDESERRSSVRSNRNSGRRSARRSRENSERLLLSPASPRVSQSAADAQSGECLRSPRVALHDVSRLLHNSQSVNIRTLMENSSDIGVSQVQQLSAVSLSDQSPDIVSRERKPENSGERVADSSVTNSEPKTPNTHEGKRKPQIMLFMDPDDPLEGPSWLLDSSECVSSSPENEVRTTMNDSSHPPNTNDDSKNNPTHDRNDDDEDDERCANLEPLWAKNAPKGFKLVNTNVGVHESSEDEDANSNFLPFVTRKRGSERDARKFSPRQREYHINLPLPVLETIFRSLPSPTQEPEQTTDIERITMTQGQHLMPDSPTRNGHETVVDHTELMLPMIEDSPDTARPSTMLGLNSSQEDARSEKKKRGRVFKRTISPPNSPSVSKAIPTPKSDSVRPTKPVVEGEPSPSKDPRSSKIVWRTYNSNGDKRPFKLINTSHGGNVSSEEEDPDILPFVTRKRGSDCPDREFTMILTPRTRKRRPHLDFHMPILESPIMRPRPSLLRELDQFVEETTETQRGHSRPDSPTINGRGTVVDRSGLVLPMTEDNPDTAGPSTMVELNSDEERARSDKRQRKRVYKRIVVPPSLSSDSEAISISKPDLARPTTTVVEQESDEEDERSDKSKRKRVNPPDSTSDPEWAPSPKRKNRSKPKRKPPRPKDPSSAKVVLLKLNDTHVKKRSPSPELKSSLKFDNRESKSAPRDVSSDSESSSIASPANKNVPSRPRRQKAPTNLQEPSLGKKLRRN